ncbi:MAG: hypothetical protein FD127_4503, partial [Acidimicrobiaceae bacterium]
MPRIELRPVARGHQHVEVGLLPVVDKQDAWQRSRILVDVSLGSVGDQRHIARLQPIVDLLDRHADGNEP